MLILSDYDQFQGLHWETGSLRNFLAYKGVQAPHTDQPYSEAMLLGISGGIVMGYYIFNYEGYDPMVRILTRNTFDPLETIYQRLDIKTTVHQTASPEKGVQNLVTQLDSGSPAIVYADMFSLPYNALTYDEGMWAMMPILVYGYDQDNDLVWIADRSRSPLTVTPEELASARGRTKKNKYRLVTHEPPKPDRLAPAVEAGLHDSVRYFTQPPPKGSKNNFGFLAYKKWVDLLTKPNQRGSWEKEFAPGPRMYAGLKSAFEDISIFGKEGGADRFLYAQFLEEASILLMLPELEGIAAEFQKSAAAWDDLAIALLPDEFSLFKETRVIMLEKHQLFLDKGSSALDEMIQINNRMSEVKAEIGEAFPLSASQAEDMRTSLADKIMKIHDIEFKAIQNLSNVLDQ
jgi:hypothetical protein